MLARSSLCFFFSALLSLGLALPAPAQVDLTLDSSRTQAEIPPDGEATTDVTFTLENTGSTDTTGVSVDVGIPSGVTVSSHDASTGSYGSGTWDGIDLPGGRARLVRAPGSWRCRTVAAAP